MKKKIIWSIILLLLLAGVICIIRKKIEFNWQKYSIETSSEWKKYSSSQILGDNTTGSLFDPFCMIDEDYEQKYRCYISKRNESSIVLYTSNDGIHFSDDYTTIIKSEKPKEYIFNRASVIKQNGMYYIYYTKQIGGKISEIYRGEGEDGIHFVFDEKPVLTATLEFEQRSVMNPDVVFNEKTGTFMMYYAAGEIYEPDVIGLATSKDGRVWEKMNEPVIFKNSDRTAADSYKIGATDVKIIDNLFYVFYIGYTDIDTGRILLTTSADGEVFLRDRLQVLAGPDKYGFDKESVYKPSAVYDRDNDRWLLYYNGRTGHNEYIGLYIKDGKDLGL